MIQTPAIQWSAIAPAIVLLGLACLLLLLSSVVSGAKARVLSGTITIVGLVATALISGWLWRHHHDWLVHAVAEAHWFNADTVTPGLSPTFFGAYVELGWFLTGESRGYKGARWDRTEVLRPIESGRGVGAIQLNLRYDRLDLDSDGIAGGTQAAFQAGLIWIPTDHVRFLFNYSRIAYDNAAIPAAGGDRDYAIDVVAARGQIDF